MRRGFTLLELIIVIIIIGVLATLGITQYGRMVERARGAEARAVIGSIRTSQAARRMAVGDCASSSEDSEVGIGSDYPGPSACNTTHYFYYDVTAGTNDGFTVNARRCTASGKSPDAASDFVGWIRLVTNFVSGADNWTTSGEY